MSVPPLFFLSEHRGRSSRKIDCSIISKVIFQINLCMISAFQNMETKSAKEKYWNEHLEYLNRRPLLGKATTMLDMQWMEDRFRDKEDNIQLCLQNKQQLPTKENVLLIFHFFRNCNKSFKNLEIAAKVLIELKKFWVRSNIPTQQDWWARKCIGI